MKSKNVNTKTLNRSRSITSKSFYDENKFFPEISKEELLFKGNNSTINQDILSNNKYSDIADEQKHYINDLLRKLQQAKEERKLAEKNSKILEHRVVLLMNQEKLVILNI